MAGKNHEERSFRLWYDDAGTGSGTARDLTGDLVIGSLTGGGGLVFDEVDMTGVSNLVKNFLAGHAMSRIAARFHMNDTATTGATTVLNGATPSATIAGTGTLTLQYGQSGAAPTTGDPEWEGEYRLIKNDVTMDGGRAIHQVEWVPSGSTAPAWGTVA